METRERMYELTSVEEVNEFLTHFPTSAFFKAGSCHKTMQGFGYVEQALNSRTMINVGFVKVVQHRPVSNYIADLTGVVHQSPQLILMLNGKPVYDVDNWDITPEALENALNKFYGSISSQVSHAGPAGALQPDVKPYLNLLQKLLSGELTEQDFQYQWLTTFQNDASPRSTKQFNLLNSLFGDVDSALSAQLFGQPDVLDSQLHHRAASLLKALNS